MYRQLLPAIALTIVAPALLRAQDVTAGQETFETTCVACHTLMPPMKLAPPMVMISRHYREKFTADSTGIAAIAGFVLEPDSLRSALPAHAIERFGLMPKPGITEAQALAVAKYIWGLSDSTAVAASDQ